MTKDGRSHIVETLLSGFEPLGVFFVLLNFGKIYLYVCKVSMINFQILVFLYVLISLEVQRDADLLYCLKSNKVMN